MPPNKKAKTSAATGPVIKLTYFDLPGPAEPARLALTLGGIAFEDKRVSFEEMKKMRENGELTSPGSAGTQLPRLEVDGKLLHQSLAQGQYCAKLAGMQPTDPWQAAKVDEAIQFIMQDIRGRTIEPTMSAPAEEKAAKRKELAEVKLPPKLEILDKILETSESGYLVGDELTLADLHLYVLCNWIGQEVLDGVPKTVITDHEHITAHCKKLNAIEAIKAWNAAKNPKLPWC
uniref:Glutathione transferase n=1 Tax=Haptolina brevifila TaxID=156173 RepID=A0A7S2E441_9EUKA|mmetsp:Transcript_47247/g.94126  ORF Transcript_47247/g.94126 Transcript_47247/m.94126 type:complete len:232 (+) Transcript_47247:48-743(+)|eukprot:CAMPEP_0174718490 /NCGR_PEP_ID=MMETSP1094-20130205/29096_1 /TAXON_ID=156173 /ORGANISM="Chrysochromulina brevifilum, Strain UTEX LB 985" /LENGTH=231 /DNA_ID=CAMNT_0015918615 /DNA_START=43 /DNA_END=738 /DNA_ORIENTATION=+